MDAINCAKFHRNWWRGLYFVRGSNFDHSHRNAMSPLTQCVKLWTTVNTVILYCKRTVASRHTDTANSPSAEHNYIHDDSVYRIIYECEAKQWALLMVWKDGEIPVASCHWGTWGTCPPDGVATLVNSLQNRVESITLCVILNAKNGK